MLCYTVELYCERGVRWTVLTTVKLGSPQSDSDCNCDLKRSLLLLLLDADARKVLLLLLLKSSGPDAEHFQRDLLLKCTSCVSVPERKSPSQNILVRTRSIFSAICC